MRWLAIAIVLAGALVGGALFLTRSGNEVAPIVGPAAEESPNTDVSPTPDESPLTLTGVVVLDGSVNGCGGENILVSVRDGAADAASESVPSALEGVDCVYRFALEVPQLACYNLEISEQPVGRYPRDALRTTEDPNTLNVGYISSDSVWGDPATGEGPPLYADWPHPCSDSKVGTSDKGEDAHAGEVLCDPGGCENPAYSPDPQYATYCEQGATFASNGECFYGD